MKTLLATVLLLLSLPSVGAAIGTHGMALVQTKQGLVASHMPLHGSMHSHQLLLTLSTDPSAQAQIDALLAQYPLITLNPETFDLHQLMHGSLNHFSATVVAGHFERGGQPRLTQVTFNVDKVLLNKPLTELASGSYYPIALGQQTLLVHRIGALPSFDQLLLVDTALESTTPVQLTEGQPTTPYQQLKGGYPLHSVYLETLDFQERE
ncbi:hypothetical protein [uncultured Ferrimonas sp.]|uniref:hypothetical protein n=1 Tax=uncultured Ferrimonas sp. TaxID=432640 RepID=UPI002618A885|nr:hypothetical protein [uncultured Ferrimonas sp.]